MKMTGSIAAINIDKPGSVTYNYLETLAPNHGGSGRDSFGYEPAPNGANGQ
jgi:hypothetical protein